LAFLRNNIRINEGVPANVVNTQVIPHRNISVILITQKLFHQGRYCRDISLNVKYLVLLKNVKNKNQFLYLALQVYVEHSNNLYRTYLDATQKPHGFLLLDTSQDRNDRLRFRTRIFRTEYAPILYACIDDETDKVELFRSSIT